VVVVRGVSLVDGYRDRVHLRHIGEHEGVAFLRLALRHARGVTGRAVPARVTAAAACGPHERRRGEQRPRGYDRRSPHSVCPPSTEPRTFRFGDPHSPVSAGAYDTPITLDWRTAGER